MNAAIWGQKLALLLRDLQDPIPDADERDAPTKKGDTLVPGLKSALRDIWSEGSYDVFEST
jgi:hypothetical protein